MVLYFTPVIGGEEAVQLKFAVVFIRGINPGKRLAVHGHVGFQLSIEPYSWGHLGVRVDTETESHGIVVVMVRGLEDVVVGRHSAGTEIIHEGSILEHLIFQLVYPYTQIVQFAGIVSGQLVQCSLLVCGEGIFLRHEAGYNLAHFIAGDILVALKSSIRIAINDAFVCQLADSLVGPVIRCYVRKGIVCHDK